MWSVVKKGLIVCLARDNKQHKDVMLRQNESLIDLDFADAQLF